MTFRIVAVHDSIDGLRKKKTAKIGTARSLVPGMDEIQG